ncbi:MAG: cytochrome c biogenesis protein CcsA [Candidatus Eisenbacteria bacterium]|nr:cytochrome c biogenesis protein CcsA [Candidatus Eisenbacteria bacterium]
MRYVPRFSRPLDLLALLLVGIALYMAYFHAPMERTMGDVQRIFYFHVPSAMMAFLGFGIVFVGSVGFLATGSRRFDGLAQSAAEIGLLFCTITLLTGPVWARSAWGVWWTWDARLSTTLILWLIYVAYLMLRSYMGGDVRMRRFSAVLGILGALDVPIVYFSVKWWRTQHPTTFITERGALHPAMAQSLRVAMLAIFVLFLALLWKRIGLERLREARDLLRASVEARESEPAGSDLPRGGTR